MYKIINKYSEFVLNETLKTHDIDLTISNTSSELSSLRYQFKISKSTNNTILIKLENFRYVRGIGQYLETLNSILTDRHGWFPTKMKITSFEGLTNEFPYDYDLLTNERRYIYFQDVEITYESKYDLEFNIPNKLYHISIAEFEKSISKNGLSPKNKSKLSKHLDRIYVCSDKDYCYNLIPKMKLVYFDKKLNNKFNKIDTKWILYEIDTSGLNLKLYKDPNHVGGFYIVDNIPVNKLKIIDKE